MARSPSSISSSERAGGPEPKLTARRALLRDVLVLLALLAGMEAYLGATLEPFERSVGAASVPLARPDLPANYHYLGARDPVAFCADLRPLADRDMIVFVGDSQGASARGPGAEPYPLVVARALAARGVEVVSFHVGGANACEQMVLLMTLRAAGLRPRAVVWSYSIFSQRKNEIRAEFVPAWRALGEQAARLAPDVILVGEGAASVATRSAAPPLRRQAARLAAAWEAVISRSAIVRFSRRPLPEKAEILGRSPLARLLPPRLRWSTARQFDPPASLLLASAKVVEATSGELVADGSRVVGFIAPINRATRPRPFSQRAETVSYPALQAAAAAVGADFLDLLSAIPPERFGTYEDGTPDAFHLDGTAHRELAALLLAAVPELSAPTAR